MKRKTTTEFVDPPLVLRLAPVLELSDQQLFDLCQVNDLLRIERTCKGDLVIMPPVGGESSRSNIKVTTPLEVWAEADGTGFAFESSAGFTLPNRAVRSPDAAWIKRERWEALPLDQRKVFAPICPDFVVELRSPSDRLADLEAKMREYIENGARMGWLIDPLQRRVYVYRPGAPVERLDNPRTVSGDPVMPGFILDLRKVWGPS